MAWMNQERKAKIVAAAKPVLAKYGMKATFRCNTHAITCTVKSGSIDFISHFNTDRHPIDADKVRSQYNFDVNPYWFDEHYKDGTAKDFISEMITALKAADYYDRSDIQTDYFDTAYYYNLKVGDWNKPYTLTTK
jgi:hypothetical protein